MNVNTLNIFLYNNITWKLIIIAIIDDTIAKIKYTLSNCFDVNINNINNTLINTI